MLVLTSLCFDVLIWASWNHEHFRGTHRLWHVQPLKGVCLPRIQSLLSRRFTPFKKGSQMHIKVTQERLNNSRVRTRGVVDSSSIRVIALGALVAVSVLISHNHHSPPTSVFPEVSAWIASWVWTPKGSTKAEASGLAVDFRIRCQSRVPLLLFCSTRLIT